MLISKGYLRNSNIIVKGYLGYVERPPSPIGQCTKPLGASTVSDTVTLIWEPPFDQFGQVAGYNILRNGVFLTAIYNPYQTNYVDNGLPFGVYSYTIQSFNNLGNTSDLVTLEYEHHPTITLGQQMLSNQSRNEPPTVSVAGANLGEVVATDQLAHHYVNTPNVQGPVVVTLATSFSNTELRYTLNGKNPTPMSRLYTGPLTFIQNATGGKTAIKVRAYDKSNAGYKSKIIRAEFRVIQ